LCRRSGWFLGMRKNGEAEQATGQDGSKEKGSHRS
jgi:hypothetical protein